MINNFNNMKKPVIGKSVIRIILVVAIVVLSAFVLTKRTNENAVDCDLQSVCATCEKVDNCDLVDKDNK